MSEKMIEVPIEILTLEDDSYHLLVDVVVNEELEGKMVVDTGASRTVIDSSLSLKVEKLQEKPYTSGIGGEVEVAFTQLNTFSIGEFKLQEISLAAIDLSAVNSAYEKVTEQRILGLLGSDLLLRHQAKIDYKTHTLYLAP